MELSATLHIFISYPYKLMTPEEEVVAPAVEEEVAEEAVVEEEVVAEEAEATEEEVAEEAAE